MSPAPSLTVTPESLEDLLEQAHEVPRGDYDRRLTTDCTALTMTTLHFRRIMFAPPASRIRLASDRLREGRTPTDGRR
jgi:hypothetical protein